MDIDRAYNSMFADPKSAAIAVRQSEGDAAEGALFGNFVKKMRRWERGFRRTRKATKLKGWKRGKAERLNGLSVFSNFGFRADRAEMGAWF